MNIKFFEHLLGQKLTVEIRFILFSILILFFSYTPIYFSHFIGNLLLFNAVFFSLYYVPIRPTYFAYFFAGILADLRFDAPLGFYGFNFILFAVISIYIHERMRSKKYYFLWGLNFLCGSFLYGSEYLLKSLDAGHWYQIRYLLIKLFLVMVFYPGITLFFSKIIRKAFGSYAS